ncbi:MAG: DUF1501 domain-containing protein [Rikenellaceae bacterium]
MKEQISRRKFLLKSLALSATAMVAPSLVGDAFAKGKSLQSAPESKTKAKKAKSVILVFLTGGPSHTDTFDPKPNAGREIYGSYKTPIETNIAGTFINQNLKNLAKIADKYSIIRSMRTNSNAHEVGQYMMYTGDMSKGSIVYPAFGSVISYLNPMDYSGNLPSYISVPNTSVRFNEAGFLGASFKSYSTGGKPHDKIFEVEGIVNKRANDDVLKYKKGLLETIEHLGAANVEQNAEVKNLQSLREQNYELILGESREVFNLNKESDELRDKYGRNEFGQSCLVARRLVEAKVPVVTVNYNGWDTHKEHFKRMDQRLSTLDMGLSALILDLDEKGLLDDTIILCGGEFGRTPKVMWEPPWNGGRGHHGSAFSYLVAGGGFKGGEVLGATDAKSEQVVERAVTPADLIGSVYKLMGIDPYGTIKHPLYGKVPLLPSLTESSVGVGLLDELFA